MSLRSKEQQSHHSNGVLIYMLGGTNMRKQLIDSFTDERIHLVEHEQKTAHWKDTEILIGGKFSEADVITGRGRIYPEAVLDRAIEQLQQRLQEGHSIFSTDSIPEDGQVTIPTVSHAITEAYKMPETKDYYCIIKPLNTERGKSLMAILNGGGKLSLSSRGVGDVKIETRNGKKVEVVQTLELHGIDVGIPLPGTKKPSIGRENFLGESYMLNGKNALKKEPAIKVDLLEEQKRFQQYIEAKKAGTSLTFEQFKEKVLHERIRTNHTREEIMRYGYALRAGWKGTIEQYVKAMTKLHSGEQEGN